MNPPMQVLLLGCRIGYGEEGFYGAPDMPPLSHVTSRDMAKNQRSRREAGDWFKLSRGQHSRLGSPAVASLKAFLVTKPVDPT